MTLLYLGLALLGVGVALAWMNGLPGGALAAALLPPLCALLLEWGVVRIEARVRFLPNQRNLRIIPECFRSADC